MTRSDFCGFLPLLIIHKRTEAHSLYLLPALRMCSTWWVPPTPLHSPVSHAAVSRQPHKQCGQMGHLLPVKAPCTSCVKSCRARPWSSICGNDEVQGFLNICSCLNRTALYKHKDVASAFVYYSGKLCVKPVFYAMWFQQSLKTCRLYRLVIYENDDVPLNEHDLDSWRIPYKNLYSILFTPIMYYPVSFVILLLLDLRQALLQCLY